MIIEKRKQLEVLGNDVTVLDVLYKNKEGTDLVYPGKYMPDGKEFRISLKGVDKMTGGLREQMVRLVRGAYDAREDEQNAEEVGKESTPETPDGGRPADARNGGRGRVPASETGDKREESLEDILRKREGFYLEELERLDWEFNRVTDARDDIRCRLEETQRCMKALQGESPITSVESDTPKEPMQLPSGSMIGGPKASRKKPTSKSPPTSKGQSKHDSNSV